MLKLTRSKPLADLLGAVKVHGLPSSEFNANNQQHIPSPRTSAIQQKRFLSIHEYLSARLLKTYGVGVPKGEVARSAAEAEKIAKEIGMERMKRVLSNG